MVSINAIQHKSSSSSINSKQKQHVTEKKKKTTTATVELKTSKQQQQQKQQQNHCTKTVIHEQAQAAGDNKNKNGSSKPRRSRLHRAWRWGWKRARRAFRAACCCCQASSTSSSCCRRRKNCFPYVRRSNADCDEEDDIDGAFERYKRQMAQLSGGGIGSTSGGDAEYDELSPSQRNTIKKLHGKSKFWNWNDSVRSTSDRFLECLELDDISCGEASLRKKFTATVVARRKQITAFYGGGREDDRTILDEIEIGSVGGARGRGTCGILLLIPLHGTL